MDALAGFAAIILCNVERRGGLQTLPCRVLLGLGVFDNLRN